MSVSELVANIRNLYIQKQTERDQMLQKALDSSYCMLSIRDFIQISEFKFNELVSLDTTWNAFRRDIPIYITDSLIRMFGYKGELFKQKEKLFKLINKYNVSVIQLNNKEYSEFLYPLQGTQTEDEKFNMTDFYPPLDTSRGKGKTLHALIMPGDLKKLWLVVNTEKGDAIREFVVSLDNLFNLYWEYQSLYKSKSLEIKDRKIDDLIQKLNETNNLVRRQSDTLQEIKEEQEVQTEVLEEVVNKLDRATDERAPALNQRQHTASFSSLS